MGNLIGQSLGRYHILEQLGEGGMATVYKAYDTRLERDVAVKVIRVDQFAPVMLERILKRFEREAKALARLTHPNIVHVNDYGEQDGIPYLVMDYLPGGTLKQRLGKPMPWQEAVKLLLPIAQALEYAHGQNIIHRDIKPSNILLTAVGQPMLSDFGIAKILHVEEGQTLTGTGVGVGTPEYMSPEQGMGKLVTASTDVYSLGVVLYELVTGRKPYTADTPMAVVVKHLSDPLPRPSEFVPGLPEVVEKVLLKALAKKPEDRYADMAALVAAMENLPLIGAQVDASEQGVAPTSEGLYEDVQTKDSQGITKEKGIEKNPQPIASQVTVVESQKKHSSLLMKKIWFPWGISGLLLLTCVGISLLYGGKDIQLLFPTLTPTFGIGSTWKRPADGMMIVYIPEGIFKMGSPDGEGSGDVHPQHDVTLDAYWIDQTEVTNAMYQKCVQEIKCKPPSSTSSSTHDSYYSNPQYADYPVIYVDWNQAGAYCQWAGARLPTEAEWEKAARGTDGRIYPWGNSSPGSSLLNYDRMIGDTTAAGSFPNGASPYGVLDMAGNVWEWVADWYDPGYYANSSSNNPTGSSFGQYRVVRGGSWYANEVFAASAYRLGYNPSAAFNYIGFRCAHGTAP